MLCYAFMFAFFILKFGHYTHINHYNLVIFGTYEKVVRLYISMNIASIMNLLDRV